MARLKVLTYNIQHGADHAQRPNLARIAAVIGQSGADVACLQEVDRHWSERSDHADQAAVLAAALGMEAFFAPIYSLPPATPGRPPRELGGAILSRLPLRGAENHSLSRIHTFEREKGVQRLPGLAEAVVDDGGQPIYLFNVHLSWLDAGVREQEAIEILDVIRRREGPVVLCGDMNGPPEAPEIQLLSAALTDAFAVAGEGEGTTYPVPAPDRRIDYVFVSPGLQVISCRVLAAEGSDHYPVLCEIGA